MARAQAAGPAVHQELPRSEESERAILAGVLLDPGLIPELAATLDPGDWWLDRHRLLWEVVTTLAAGADSVVDLRTVQAELERRGQLDAVGGLTYLVSLDLDLPDLGRIDSYAAIVRDRAVRRRAIDRAQEVIRAAQADTPTAELVAGAEEAYRTLGAATAPRGLVPVGQVVARVLDPIEEGEVQRLQGIPTGWPELDRVIYGLAGGRLIIVAGRPGSGKSSFARGIGCHVALREGKHVAVWSLEMTADEVVFAALCAEARVPNYRLRTGHLSTSQWQHLVRSARELSAAPLRIDDQADPTVRTIRAEALRLHAAGELDLVIADYLQLMSEPQARGWSGNRNLELASITRGMKGLAKELDIPVVLLSQLSRDPERRKDDHRPRLADLRDSGAVEQDADLVLFIHREERYQPDNPDVQGLAEVIIGKHRHGEEATVTLAWDGPTTRFASLSPAAAPPPQLALPAAPPTAAAAAAPTDQPDDPF